MQAWSVGWFRDPVVIGTFLTWFVYAGLLYVRGVGALEPRRVNVIVAIGFCLCLTVFLVSALLPEGLH